MIKSQLYGLAALLWAASVVGAGWWMHDVGQRSGELKAVKAEAAASKRTLDAIALDVKAGLAGNEELRDKLAKIPTSTGVTQIVRSNPSQCVYPDAVADRMRNEVKRANQAIPTR